MANPEHLKRIGAGIERWNEWRRDHPRIAPDLSGADLSGMNLNKAHLRGADLNKADLSNACLIGANLRGASLKGANLSGARIREANLNGADLSGANLTKANLRALNLTRVNLSGADLSKAQLKEVCLIGANLRRADLSGSDLRHATLVRSDLRKAELTGARLFGTSRDDWIVAGVKCRYVFWDCEGRHRSPSDRDLEAGEFDRLYRTLPTIEYIFEDGISPIDPLIMDRLVESIGRGHPEYEIAIDSIVARGLAPSIRFTVRQEQYMEPALAEVTRMYCEYLECLRTDKYALSASMAQMLESDRIAHAC
jgi:uncharacterized protein YjbI with pentapeptide repeats